MWYYKNPLGLFRIIHTSNGYELYLNDDCYGCYHDPVAAADDVYTGAINSSKWTNLVYRINPPMDLSEWHHVKKHV